MPEHVQTLDRFPSIHGAEMISRSSVLAAALFIATVSRPAAADSSANAPRVLVVTMFGGEAKPWLDGETVT
jgi:purine nucleoside permease